MNRIVSWHGRVGVKYGFDPRHIEIIVEQLKLRDAKFANSPGIRDEGRIQEYHENQLDTKEASSYRAIVARCNYIAPDRPDIAYVVKDLARHMTNLTNGDLQRLKRFGRFQRTTTFTASLEVATTTTTSPPILK